MTISRADLPNTQTMQTVSSAAADAIVKILEMAIHADAKVSAQELETLRVELKKLPATITPKLLQNTTEADFFQKDSQDRYDPQLAMSKLDATIEPIQSALEKQTCVRLLAVLCCCDGLAASEIDFYRHVVNKLDYNVETAEDILRSALETRNAVNTPN